MVCSRLEHPRVVDLQQLVAAVALEPAEEVVLDDLHRDRRRALLRGVGREVGQHGAHEAAHVDAVVDEEVLVLDGEERVDHVLGHRSAARSAGGSPARRRRSRCRRCRTRTSAGRVAGTTAARRAAPRGRWRAATVAARRRRRPPSRAVHRRRRRGPAGRTNCITRTVPSRLTEGSRRSVAAAPRLATVPPWRPTVPLRRPGLDGAPTAGPGSSSPARSRTSATPRSRCPTTSATSWRRCRR